MIHEIALLGIDEVGRHGVFDHEREHGQPFIVDVRFRIEIDEGQDQLTATADYGQIVDLVRTCIAGTAVNLIETLARNLLTAVLTEHPAIVWAQVTVHKPQAPLTRAISDISVTVSEQRSAT